MKYIQFKKISISNFLSIGREPVSIEFETGTNIITGTNKDMMDRRNGVGKTTIADALYFAIFGNTIRELKKELIVNNFTNDVCSVDLTFSIQNIKSVDEYRIVRTLNPSKCFLFENGKDVTRDSIANTTQHICSLIDASPEIFQNCVIMTLNNTVPFMAQTKAEKRKFIESIFNLQMFSKMMQHVKDEYNEAKKQHELELFKSNELKININKLNEQRNYILRERSSKIAELQERKNKSNDTHAKLQQELMALPNVDVNEINDTIKELEMHKNKCIDKIDELMQKVAVTEMQIKNLYDQCKKISEGTSTCPACLRTITENDAQCIHREKTAMIEQAKQLAVDTEQDKQQLLKQRENKDALSHFITKYKAKVNQANIVAVQKQSLQKEINSLLEWNKTVDDDIAKLSTTSTELDEIIVENETKNASIESKIHSILTNVNMLGTMKTVVSEEGVKSYITKKILQILNSKIQLYLQKIGFNCVCKFNEYFEEEILNDRGKTCSYFNFSGAERKSIDLACLFAFIDIRKMQGSVAYNVVFYDELLDSSLDEQGVELAYQIIAERARNFNECAYIITHRKSSNFFATSKVIQLVKENGITIRVD
jgi:DNA repair exonuclease SbcCD ATPase subunit